MPRSRTVLEASTPVARAGGAHLRFPGRLTFVRKQVSLSTAHSASFLLASLGVHSLQWHLLSSLWRISPRASLVAVGGLAWILGTLVVRRVRRPVRWEALLLVGGIFSFLLDWRLPATAYTLCISVSGMLLGMTSAGWLTQARPWSDGHSVILAERTWMVLMSLAIVWLLPARLGIFLAFACLIPLLLIDACHPAQFQPLPVAPHPAPGVHRDALRLRLLACLVEGVQVALWNAIPVPLAAAFERSRHLNWFLWLLAGAIAAWALWCVCERALSPALRRTPIALFAVAMMAVGLVAFTFVQAPLLLAVSMTAFALGNLLLGGVVSAAGAAPTDQAGGSSTLERLPILLGLSLSVPIGVLIDLVSIDGALLLICACLFLFALCTAWDLLISLLVARDAAKGGGQ